MKIKRELIDIQELYEILCHDERHGLYVDHTDGYEDHTFFNGCGNDFLAIMNKATIIDAVEVVHGQWIAVPSSDMMTGKAYKCSVCGKMRYGSFTPNYCAICGAKMDGEKHD